MKNYLILVLALFLTGCSARYPLTANLLLQVDPQPVGLYNGEITATLKGHDDRKDSSVVVYRLQGESEVRIPNETEPHILVTDQLAAGLQEQGLVFVGGAPVRIELDVNELVAMVTRPKYLYVAKARSHLTLTISNRGFSLSKTYDREAGRESARKPSVLELEKLLNDQLSEIVTQILQDQEVRAAIVKKT